MAVRVKGSDPSHDRIADEPRARTCIHEAGHVAMCLLTKTKLIRANAYRHYSTASLWGRGAWGYTQYGPASSPVRELLIEGAGIIAERLLINVSVKQVLRCTDRLPEDDETFDLCRDLLDEHSEGVIRIARLLRDSRGYVSGPALTSAFWEV